MAIAANVATIDDVIVEREDVATPFAAAGGSHCSYTIYTVSQKLIYNT